VDHVHCVDVVGVHVVRGWTWSCHAGADVVIVNGGTIEQLHANIDAAFAEVHETARAH
jgi:hypothetical protein